MDTVRVCFVCLGNICRSPTAEGVARALMADRSIDGVEVDSAGTGAWHVGEPPDARASEAAAQRGIRLTGTARTFQPGDFDVYDLVVAMDRSNLRELQRLSEEASDPPPIRLLREWDPMAGDDLDVPDPYYHGGFELVLDIITRSVNALLSDLADR